jgi:ubiquinone biosynthesis UbiH/UbiF/VisC/COQ6 family hydroxylase
MTQRVVIVGGGMVGLAFGVALAAVAGEHLSITILEAAVLPSGTPDPLDTRASAINAHSRDVLAAWGVWDGLEARAQCIRKIHVSNRHRFGSSLMSRADVSRDALGYVCENHYIGRALLERAEALGVRLEAPVDVVGLSPRQPSGYDIQTRDGHGASHNQPADLVLLAEGGRSGLCQQLGIAIERRPTGQVGLVANVVFPGAQQGVAFERFTSSGPFALLPLPTTTPNQQRFNMVWCLTPERADRLSGLPKAALLAEVQQTFGWRLGRALDIGHRSTWRLDRLWALEQVRRGLVVVGNAAHALHPVAGQGVNLSLRDAHVFASVIAGGVREHRDIGDMHLLRSYQDRVIAAQESVVASTDWLATSFTAEAWAALPGSAALAALDTLSPLRRLIAQRGAGLWGESVDVA